jgi:hypothetical protein
MPFDVKWVLGVPLAGLVLLGLVGESAWAQPPQGQPAPQGQPGQPGNFRVPPGFQTPTPPNIAAMTSAPPQAGFQPPVFSTPYYGTGAYAPYYNPYGGFMSGVADIQNAIGQSAIAGEQAGIVRQQKFQAQIDTRRKNFDEWLYERDATPTPEDNRERARIEQIRRSRNDPPPSEIWSGQALNTLMTAILQAQIQHGPGPSIPLDPGVVQRLNVTAGATAGNVGMLRDGGKLKWPLPLTRPAYETDRMRITELAPVAYKQATSGQVQPDVLQGLIDSANSLNTLISQNVASLTPKEYSQGKSFVRELNSTIAALQDPNVASYVTRKWAPKGNMVGEVVNEMNRQGLKFAPATRGDEPAYVAMHNGMVAYLNWDPSRPWDTLTK